MIVESDEEVGAETHDLPEDEQPEEVVRKDHAEHACTEEHEFCIESVIAVLIHRIRVHVPDAEDVDQHAQEGRHEEQHDADVVEIDAESEIARPRSR